MDFYNTNSMECRTGPAIHARNWRRPAPKAAAVRLNKSAPEAQPPSFSQAWSDIGLIDISIHTPRLNRNPATRRKSAQTDGE